MSAGGGGPRARARAAAGRAAAAAGPRPAAALAPVQDGGTVELSPPEAYEARLKTALPQIGAQFETPAVFAMGNKLKRTAKGVFETILEFDPENQKARRELGYDRKGTEWVLNEKKREKIDEYEDESGKKIGDFNERLGKAQVAASRILSELGDLAEKAEMGDKARVHWRKALFYDDQNEIANKRLENKLVDGKWFTQRALNHKDFIKVYRKTLDDAQKLGVAVVSADDSTGIAEAAGIPVRRYKTANFRLESNLSDAEIRETLVWLERGRSFFLNLFEIPERMLDYQSDPLVFVIVTTDEQKDKLIDACSLLPPEKKSFNKKFSAVKVTNKLDIRREPNGESAQRHCLHTGTHTMVVDTFGQHAPWLSEALANSVSAALRGADLSVCFSGEGSTGGIHLERLGLEEAPALLRQLVLAKKDTPIGEFVKLPSDGMNSQQIAKAWSVVMFLLERDRMQARGYFEAAGQGQGGDNSKEDRVLKQYFEDFPKWKDLDEAWREWAVDVYKEK